MEETTEINNIIHKPKEPVLIVEDILENQILLKNLCKHLGLDSVVAENGQEALDLVQKQEFSVFIVDLMLPVMDGSTFISELKKIHSDPVVLIQSAMDSSDIIIKVMKLGVFDYIIKPIDAEVFQKIMKKALEFRYLRDMEKNLSENASLKLRNQLEWLNYKESRRKTSEDSSEILSIENLKTSLSQGAGIGSMVTLIDLITTNPKLDESGKNILVDKNLFDMIEKNNNFVRNLLDGLISISDILQKEMKLTETDARTVMSKLPEMIKNVLPFFNQKNLQVSYPQFKNNCKLFVNFERLQQAIEELSINAFKYSPSNGGNIDFFAYIAEGYFCISIKNDVTSDPYFGIPSDQEKLVKEPFFRILPPVEGIADVEKFGLGLGLTVVDHVAAKHHGMFFIHDVKDHTQNTPRLCVVAEIYIPVAAD